MRRIALTAAVILAAVTNLWAQGGGQLPAWNVLGNPSAAASNARSASLNAMFNGAFCSTANALVARVGGSWVCQGLGTGLSFAAGNLTVAPPWSSITGTPTTLSGYGITSPLPYAQGGCNATTQAGCTNNIFPTPTRAGDIVYWNGSTWVTLPGNNSGTQTLTENASGIPAWAAAGSGTVTSIGIGTGLSSTQTPLTTTGTLSVDASYLRGFMSGLTLANDGVTPNTVIDIAAGVAASDDATTLMKLASAITKNMNSTWVVGSTNGCADGAGGYTTLAASTWYHIFEIERTDTGIVDSLCSLSATSPTFPANYTKKKRLGSVKTDGAAHILAFTQVSNQFTWAVPPLDFSSTIGITRSSITLSVPTGVVVSASVVANGGSTGNSVIWVGPLTVTDGAPSLSATPPGMLFFQNVAGATSSSGGVNMMTNTSAQVGARADTAATSLKIFTNGWTDFL